MSDFWIRFWNKDEYSRYKQDAAGDDINGGPASHFYAGIYGALTVAFFVIQVCCLLCLNFCNLPLSTVLSVAVFALVRFCLLA